MNININDILKTPELIELVSKLGIELTKSMSPPSNPVTEETKFDQDTSEEIIKLNYLKNLIGYGLFKNKYTQEKYILCEISDLITQQLTTKIVTVRSITDGKSFSVSLETFIFAYIRSG